MEPTIGVNDGFFVIPADSIETGDIITFRAPQRDSYVTHRVVGESELGFITKGDNNPSTDQSTGYSHVTSDEIVGQVATYHETPITIPGYGTAVSTLRSYSPVILLGLGLVLLVQSVGTSTQGTRPVRSLLRVRDVLLPLFAMSVISAIVFMLVGATVYQFTFVAVATASGAPNTLTVGEEKTTTLLVNRSETPLMRSVVTAENMQLTEQNRNESSITVTARIPPPDSTGAYMSRVSVHRYPAVLPLSLLQQLGRIHPLIPASISTVLVVGPIYVIPLIAFDGKTPIRPSRARWVHRLREMME